MPWRRRDRALRSRVADASLVVVPSERLVPAIDDLDVLLRHRSPSIPPCAAGGLSRLVGSASGGHEADAVALVLEDPEIAPAAVPALSERARLDRDSADLVGTCFGEPESPIGPVTMATGRCSGSESELSEDPGRRDPPDLVSVPFGEPQRPVRTRGDSEGRLFGVGTTNSVTLPVVVTRPILPVLDSVNQTAPSGPAMPTGALSGVGIAISVTLPVVIRPTLPSKVP